MLAQTPDPGSRTLRSPTRIFWVLLTLVAGAFPSALFFVWIERNMALPMPLHDLLAEFFLGGKNLPWPWITLWDYPAAVRIGWNLALYFAFGFFHTLLAQRPVQGVLRRVLPPQCVRAFYLCFTGISAFVLMGLWQNTGIIAWKIPGLSYQALQIVSIAVFYPLLLTAFRVMAVFDPLEFLGLSQLYSRADELDTMVAGGKLLETGFYSRVRHPMYFFTLLAILAAPMMSLDRLVLLAAIVLYLYFALPIEERKLESRFGETYREYRKRVPAVFPRLGTRVGSR